MDILRLMANYEKQKKVFMKTMGRELGGYLQSVVSQYPEVESIRWTQYTPYFNDGDECVFGVHELYVKFYDINEDGDEDNGFMNAYDIDKKHQPILKKIRELRKNIPGEVLKNVFGDHCQITVTRDSCEVEPYDHD